MGLAGWRGWGVGETNGGVPLCMFVWDNSGPKQVVCHGVKQSNSSQAGRSSTSPGGSEVGVCSVSQVQVL